MTATNQRCAAAMAHINLDAIKDAATRSIAERANGVFGGGFAAVKGETVLALVAAVQAAQALADAFDPIGRTEAREDLRKALQPFSEPKT